MKVEHHVWHTARLGREMGVRVYGHWGAPLLVFPTSGGDEWEFERQGMLDALGHHVDAGKVKLFCVNSVNNQSWYDKGAHPRHRSYVQAMYDAYVAEEVAPFIHTSCESPGIAITTTGASFGAYHAANFAGRYPGLVTKAVLFSGLYHVGRFLDGYWDDLCYYHSPQAFIASGICNRRKNHSCSCFRIGQAFGMNLISVS